MKTIDVFIVMGSASDASKAEPAIAALKGFGVPFDAAVCSAHRSPKKLAALVASAEKRGCLVFIALAGKAAHLPGVVAAHTAKPVIGVPIDTPMMGLDSLLSIAQMPPGVPVATVGVDAGKNAALLAIQMLALSDAKLAKKLADYKAALGADVAKQNAETRKKLRIPKLP